MAQIPGSIIAQFSIDFATDALVGSSFGVDESSLTVVQTGREFSINLDNDSQAVAEDRQIVASADGLLEQTQVISVVGPPAGFLIESATAAGILANSTLTRTFTVIRKGAVS